VKKFKRTGISLRKRKTEKEAPRRAFWLNSKKQATVNVKKSMSTQQEKKEARKRARPSAAWSLS